MNAAASSWCTRTNFTRSALRRSPSMIPLMPSPGSPNTVSTPQSASRATRTSAAIAAIPSRYPDPEPRISCLPRLVPGTVLTEVRDMTDIRQRDVVSLLLEQHNEVKDLFRRLEAAQGTEKREIFQDLVRLLAVHESAEEAVVHPAARRAISDGEQVVESRLQEENEAKQALVELYDLGVDHPEFDAKLAALREAVIAHATREENDEVLYLRQNLPAERLRRIAGAQEAADKGAPTRPHPQAGEVASANLVAGPPAGIFDRVRDAVRDWRESHRDD